MMRWPWSKAPPSLDDPPHQDMTAAEVGDRVEELADQLQAVLDQVERSLQRRDRRRGGKWQSSKPN